MGVQKENWVDFIQGNLFKANDFVMKAHSENDSVLNGVVVYLPQAGAKPTVVKNRTTLPATASKRTDTVISYPLDWYTTDPFHIQNAEQAELSYDKMSSVLGEHLATLRDYIGDEMAVKWLTGAVTAGNIVSTSGGATASTETGQTGNRKLLLTEDVKKLMTLMNKKNVAKEGRVLVLESNMLDQLTTSLGVSQYRDFSQYFDAANGVIGKLYGFEIMERSSVGIINAAKDTVDAVGAAIAATDHIACLAFQKDHVTTAMGDIKFYDKTDDPLYYGDVYSADVRFGGRVRRTGAEGVYALVQDASA